MLSRRLLTYVFTGTSLRRISFHQDCVFATRPDTFALSGPSRGAIANRPRYGPIKVGDFRPRALDLQVWELGRRTEVWSEIVRWRVSGGITDMINLD